MEWYTDAVLRIDDLHAQPAYADAFAAFQEGEDLTQPQLKLMRQMERATARLAELKGLSQLALADAKKELEGVELPDSVTLALEFLSETAVKGVARAKARAKILALVSDKGPEVGWKMCEKLERKSYANDEEDEKLMRKAEKEVKAEKLHDVQAATAKGRSKGLGRGLELSEEEIGEAVPLCEQDVPVPRVA
eukprot:gene20628-biopygen21263